MEAEPTLKLNHEIINSARKYAADKKLSLSRIVEVYLESLTTEPEPREMQVSPFVRTMSTGKSMPAERDYKKEYYDYLTKKYQ